MNVYAIVDGVEYDLNDGVIAYFEGYDGLGMPDLHRLDERGPLQHGSTDRGYRLDPRFPAYVFGLLADTPEELDDKEEALIRIFRPSRTIKMRHVRDSGRERCLDCVFSEGMKLGTQDRKGRIYKKVGIVLKADDPTFYDPEAIAITFQLGGGSGAWEFPWEIPWEVGASTIDQAQAIQYDGDAPTYPTLIRITGPIDDPIITNESTGEVLDFTGASITGGDYYDIDLRYGLKTVVDSSGVDVFDELLPTSDHATWHIAADDEVPDGINTIRVQGTNITATTKVELTYYKRSHGS